jgi:acyl-coenzyme A thioesterase PaaI-like protein
MKVMRLLILASVAGLAVSGTAQPYPGGGWGGVYAEPPLMGPNYGPLGSGRDPREGKIDAAAFVTNSPGAAQLGHGPIVVAPAPGGLADGAYESALADQLAKAGYETNAQPRTGGQTVEFVVSHDVIQPSEPPRSPVGGAVSAGAGSHGWGGVGMAINIDLSKPRGALVATRIEARIRDRATNELLWQGRAQVVAREGDKHWTPQATAAKLTEALFKSFPKPS